MWSLQPGSSLQRSHWRLRLAALIALLALGVGVRGAGCSDQMVSFNSTRQFHCAVITRALYYGWTRTADDPARQSAERASERRGELEPPIVQVLAAGAYAASGGEHLGVARVLGSVSWMSAALLLYALARSLLGADAALIALGYFLLVPFGVIASQSFQPDPLMLLAMVASWLAIARLQDRPTQRAALLAGALSGVAILIKPVCLFAIAWLYLALWVRGVFSRLREEQTLAQHGLWSRAVLRVLGRHGPLAWGALTAAPSALWYLPRLLGGRLHSQAEQSFLPALLSTPRFWSGWYEHAQGACGGPAVLGAALVGLLVVPAGRARTVLWSLIGGYAAYGLIFNYHISTHDYYQLPLLPIVALCLAALAGRAVSLSHSVLRQIARVAIAAGALVLCGFAVRDIRANVWPRTHVARNDERGYTEIGALVQHSPKVVFLTPNASGGPLEFVAGLSGWYWPCRADLRRNHKRGRPPFDWQKAWQERVAQGAEYFVITPAEELGMQPWLAGLLRAHPMLSDSPKYLVYDLRRTQ